MSSEHTNPGKENLTKIADNKYLRHIIDYLNNPYNLALAALLIAVIISRVKYFYIESIWNDAAVHLWYSIKVLKEPLFLFTSHFMEDYITVQSITSFLYIFIRDIFLAANITALLFTLFGAIVIYYAGQKMRNKFTGLVASLLFCFNPFSWFIGSRLLADNPLTVMCAFTILCFFMLEEKKSMLWAVISGLSILLAIATKMAGVLLVFIVLIYLIISRGKSLLKDKYALIAIGIPIITIVAGSVLYPLIFGKVLHTRLFGQFVNIFKFQSEFNYIKLLPAILSWKLIILMIGGGLCALYYKNKKALLPILMFVLYLFHFEFGVGGALPRYILPVLAPAVLLAGFAISELREFTLLFVSGKRKITELVVGGALILVILIFITAPSITSTTEGFIIPKSYGYTGYQEAGRWIMENSKPDDIVYAGSPRSMRLFTQREYFEDMRGTPMGGSLYFLRGEKYLDNRSYFELEQESLSKEHDIYLEIDTWEYTQPEWYYPLSQESLTYFESIGFKVAHVVYREYPSDSGLSKMPVIILLKKEKGWARDDTAETEAIAN